MKRRIGIPAGFLASLLLLGPGCYFHQRREPFSRRYDPWREALEIPAAIVTTPFMILGMILAFPVAPWVWDCWLSLLDPGENTVLWDGREGR
ncbi:MAG: hypothetical protein L0216_12895 [Planctomycetales bacterium]|nr:hypothetical protein [Planctomycetales bacterium]